MTFYSDIMHVLNIVIFFVSVGLIILCVIVIALLVTCHIFDIKPAKNNQLMQFLLNLFGMHHISNSEIANEIFYKIQGIHSEQTKMIYIGGYSNSTLLDGDSNNNINFSLHGDAAFIEFNSQTFHNIDTYRKTFDLIKHYKKIKPVSSYVLHLSLNELREPSDEIISKIKDRLIYASQSVYMPVYFVITGLETMQNSNAIRDYLSKHQQIIGWSDNTASMFSNLQYSTNNINDAYTKIHTYIQNKIEQLCFSISTQNPNHNTAMFSDELMHNLSSLKHLLHQIFGHQTEYFLRGIYFAGPTLLTKHIALEDLGKYKDNYSKINLHLYKITFAAIFALYVGLGIKYVSLLYRSHKTINYLSRASVIQCYDLNQQSLKEFLFVIEGIYNNRLQNAFMPISILSMLKTRVNHLLAKIYNKMIIQNIYLAFNNMMHSLDQNQQRLDMFQYADECFKTYKIYHAIMSLGLDGSIANLNYIIQQLFNINLPNEYNKYPDLYKAALKNLPKIDNIENYRTNFANHLVTQTHAYAHEFIQFANLFDKAKQLQVHMEDIQENPYKHSVETIDTIHTLAHEIRALIDQYINNWAAYDNIDNNSQIGALMHTIKQCKFFKKDTAQYIQEYIKNEFQKAKDKLALFHISSIGPICERRNDHTTISREFLDFTDGIKSLNEKIQYLKEENHRLTNDTFATLEWNIDKLQSVYKTITDLNIVQITQNIPVTSRQTIKILVKNILAKYIQNSIDNSLIENYQKKNIEYAIDNIKQAMSLVLKTMNACDAYDCKHVKDYIKSILKNQIEKIFEYVKDKINDDDLYNPLYISANPVHAKMQLTKDREMLINLYRELAPIIKIYSEQWPYYEWSTNGITITSINNALAGGVLEELESAIMAYHNIKSDDLSTCLEAVKYKRQQSDQIDFIQSRQALLNNAIDTKINKILTLNMRNIYPILMQKFKSLQVFFPFNKDGGDIPEHMLSDFYNLWSMHRHNLRMILQIDHGQKWHDSLQKLEQCMRWFEAILEPQQFKSGMKIISRTNKDFERNMKYIKTWDINFMHEHAQYTCDMSNILHLDKIHFSEIDVIHKIAKNSGCSFIKAEYDDDSINIVKYKSKYAILHLLLKHLSQIQNQQITLRFANPVLLNNAQDQIIGWCTIELSGHIDNCIRNNMIDFNCDDIDFEMNI